LITISTHPAAPVLMPLTRAVAIVFSKKHQAILLPFHLHLHFYFFSPGLVPLIFIAS
jgi:hypothetical protein